MRKKEKAEAARQELSTLHRILVLREPEEIEVVREKTQRSSSWGEASRGFSSKEGASRECAETLDSAL